MENVCREGEGTEMEGWTGVVSKDVGGKGGLAREKG